MARFTHPSSILLTMTWLDLLYCLLAVAQTITAWPTLYHTAPLLLLHSHTDLPALGNSTVRVCHTLHALGSDGRFVTIHCWQNGLKWFSAKAVLMKEHEAITMMALSWSLTAYKTNKQKRPFSGQDFFTEKKTFFGSAVRHPDAACHCRYSHSFMSAQALILAVQSPSLTNSAINKLGLPGHVLAGFSPREPCHSSRVSYVDEGVVQHIFSGTQAIHTHQPMLHWKKKQFLHLHKRSCSTGVSVWGQKDCPLSTQESSSAEQYICIQCCF